MKSRLISSQMANGISNGCNNPMGFAGGIFTVTVSLDIDEVVQRVKEELAIEEHVPGEIT